MLASRFCRSRFLQAAAPLMPWRHTCVRRFSFHCCMEDPVHCVKAPFGTLLGVTDGDVHVYSSDYSSLDPAVRANRAYFQGLVGGITTGYKWQCVELGRRYLLVNHGVVFDNIAMAYDIFRLKTVTRVADGALLPLQAHVNGTSTTRPTKGSLLIWNPVGEFTQTGHVAVVVAVTDTHVDIAEQNVHDAVWPPARRYSRRLPARVDAATGAFTLTCTYDDASILGWMTVDLSSEYNFEDMPRFDPASDLVRDTHGRVFVTPDGDAALDAATTQLYHMVLDATDYVLQHTDAFQATAFADVPAALWPHIRASWYAQKPDDLVGRVAFDVAGRGLVWRGFAANGLSAYVAARGNVAPSELVHAWRAKAVTGPLHLLADSPTYDVARATAEAAGLTCHALASLDTLQEAEGGGFLDEAGRPVQTIWHSAPWPDLLRRHGDGVLPALVHPSIRFIEPLWTMLADAPGLTDVLRQLYPHHPLLRPPTDDNDDASLSSSRLPDRLETFALKGRYAGAVIVDTHNPTTTARHPLVPLADSQLPSIK
ncbi:Aste57867_21828 [Aphanomyces stellatus]|uniref:Aste57867_21828 protein n=1 Tax=Aphanomyces stellatus TaxID=120398 RepID=A0A485LIJ2_9STRA|nr:hypothetical protein As57867_021759 [Aphanomyces stellatus]VFT98497.1 Aste57867_21828 [Aphanomyces stellatus]